ncbi:MAG: bifunctional 2-C-methyl-D-erythritol 4-phosphate cytidylyltransferase/2-C-methyl-D-erythritol 2,4-cyclodiphosphate synthase [Alphaproteobacteria bacterium]|nr:bifunctional 2-C-methyl-D-erythritol 4-phosphate cytidylyltransferase/2-C-methyl-D-erythritol 2,4-cyclodiphosphate synthase [Alphaproteobacteria bacterium]
MPTCIALIVAAGNGSRFGGSLPKQYLDLGGESILRRSVLAFLDHPHIDAVQVVINPEHRDMYDRAVGDLDLPEPIEGGDTRQQSVLNGLETLAASGGKPDFVMIHDAARPLIDAATITDVRRALDAATGAIAAKPLVDTLKRANGAAITATIDRANLWQAHTPQAFHFNEILVAHRAAAGAQLTDDAAVAEKSGMTVSIVPSNPDNMKITNPDDLDRAARLLGHNYGDIRTGMGYDVHRLIPGDAITICGVSVPHSFTAEGHSDADVGLHALVDAILGAMGAGDIGMHFPPSDPQWKGKDSAHFVRHAVGMVNERGGIIAHADVTIICEAPKIGPHREAMVARMAKLLEIAPSRVSVKATTTEKLGFTGRGEGIAAQAVATLRFPG